MSDENTSFTPAQALIEKKSFSCGKRILALHVAQRYAFMGNMKSAILDEMVRRAGSANAVAEACEITVQAVYLWQRVPAEHCLKIEALTGIRRERLRPDVFGAPRTRPRGRAGSSAAA